MREEEEANWFARWEEQLPSPEELMPLSQLITPDLALAFDIPTIRSNPNPNPTLHHHHPAPSLHPPPPAPSSQPPPDFDSPDHLTTASSGGGACGGGGGEEPARTLKRPRLVCTPQLHKRFVDAVAHLGIKNAVPTSSLPAAPFHPTSLAAGLGRSPSFRSCRSPRCSTTSRSRPPCSSNISSSSTINRGIWAILVRQPAAARDMIMGFLHGPCRSPGCIGWWGRWQWVWCRLRRRPHHHQPRTWRIWNLALGEEVARGGC